MGRWAQRRRSGGGNGQPAGAVLSIVGFTAHSSGSYKITYNGPINVAILNPVDFVSNPSGEVGATIVQLTATELEWANDATNNTDTEIVYSGSAPFVQSPQTFP